MAPFTPCEEYSLGEEEREFASWSRSRGIYLVDMGGGGHRGENWEISQLGRTGCAIRVNVVGSLSFPRTGGKVRLRVL